MPRALSTILLLMASNTFMTLAWYGHLRFKDLSLFRNTGTFGLVLISWGIAFFEYLLMVPANRLGAAVTGGPFNMWQLKLIQEVISISVFMVFTLILFKTDELRWNHIIGFLFLLLSVYFFFRK
ncbi:MAG TPA: DMT family protein [Bacteroidia bacterium]|nr:DMT family protein [Bacteroidia bacterium]